MAGNSTVAQFQTEMHALLDKMMEGLKAAAVVPADPNDFRTELLASLKGIDSRGADLVVALREQTAALTALAAGHAAPALRGRRKAAPEPEQANPTPEPAAQEVKEMLRAVEGEPRKPVDGPAVTQQQKAAPVAQGPDAPCHCGKSFVGAQGHARLACEGEDVTQSAPEKPANQPGVKPPSFEELRSAAVTVAQKKGKPELLKVLGQFVPLGTDIKLSALPAERLGEALEALRAAAS